MSNSILKIDMYNTLRSCIYGVLGGGQVVMPKRLVKVAHDPHFAATCLHHGGAVEGGTVVVYQPRVSVSVWGAEYTTELAAIGSICAPHVR